MKPQGSLAQHDFPILVQGVYERAWTGVLSLTAAGITKKVVVQGGRLVFASSSSRDERLGGLKLRRGRITLRQLANASQALVPGKRLGTALVEQGAITPKDLVRSVVEHTQEIIYGAFQWTEGQYRHDEGGDTREAIKLNLSTPDVIMEGIRRIDSWTRIERAVGSLATRYERAADHEEKLRGASLAAEKLALVTDLAGPRTLEEICDTSTLPDFEVCRTVWALHVMGAVQRLDAAVEMGEGDDDGLGLVMNGE